MSRTNIIAREEECRKLSRALNEEEAQLEVVTGRLRGDIYRGITIIR